jgi:glycosyltransferase involved in cell wall biosynthesis
MKIGIFAGDSKPESGGGFTFVQEVVEQTAALAKTTDHQFVVLTTTDAGADYLGLPALKLPSAVANWPLRVRRTLGRNVARLLARPVAPPLPDPLFADSLQRSGVDLVWYVQPLASYTLELPYITTVWDLQHRLQPFFPEVTQGGEYEFRDDRYAMILRRAAAVITGCETGSREIQRFYGVAPERILLAPHPTPSFALADASAAVRPARAPAGQYLYYPAQFWPHKNHVNLLRALKLVREVHRLPVSLVLSGSDKGNRDFVHQQARQLGVADAVSDLGFVERAELIGLYRHAFALCYVTLFGPENMPPLEAFALGCPVIASDVAGAREQMGDAALLVEPTSPEQIATAVAGLHADPGLAATLVERGRARARQFTGREFVERVFRWLDWFAAIRRNWPAAGPT